MSVWVREILGWVLLGIGLAAFAMCYVVFLLNRWIVESFVAAFIGFTVFRAGMHLLKVATAARAARDVSQEFAAAGMGTKRIRPALAEQNMGRQRKSVVPGPNTSAEPARPRR